MGMMGCRMMRIRRRKIRYMKRGLPGYGEEMRVLGSLHD